jgi:hypothetical protein
VPTCLDAAKDESHLICEIVSSRHIHTLSVNRRFSLKSQYRFGTMKELFYI